jgi:hypothetical protein
MSVLEDRMESDAQLETAQVADDFGNGPRR